MESVIRQVVLTWRRFCPLWIFGNIWRHFGLSHLGQGQFWEKMLPAFGGWRPSAAERSAMHRTAPIPESSSPKCLGARVERAWSRQVKKQEETKSGPIRKGWSARWAQLQPTTFSHFSPETVYVFLKTEFVLADMRYFCVVWLLELLVIKLINILTTGF